MSRTPQIQTQGTSLARARDAGFSFPLPGERPAGWASRRAAAWFLFAFLQAHFGPPGLRSRRGGARSSRMGRDDRGVRSSAPGARPGIPPLNPAAGGGEGRCAVRAVTRAAPAQPGGCGGRPGTRCPGGPAPRPSAPGPPAALSAARPGPLSKRTPPPLPRRDPGACGAPALLRWAGAAPNRPSLPYLGPFPFQLEELQAPGLSGASRLHGPGAGETRLSPLGRVVRAGGRTKKRALPGLAWACSEPGCFPQWPRRSGAISRFCGSLGAKPRGGGGWKPARPARPVQG